MHLQVQIITFAYKYLRKKFNKKLIPWRNAPAIETTTTWRSFKFSSSKIFRNSLISKLNVWFISDTIWIALAELISPAETIWKRIPMQINAQINFIATQISYVKAIFGHSYRQSLRFIIFIILVCEYKQLYWIQCNSSNSGVCQVPFQSAALSCLVK